MRKRSKKKFPAEEGKANSNRLKSTIHFETTYRAFDFIVDYQKDFDAVFFLHRCFLHDRRAIKI